MPFHYDLETDIRYQQGVEKGIEKGAELKAIKFVKNLLNDGSLTVEKIVALADVPLEKVLHIQQEMAKEKNGRKRKK